ncbi:nuclear transport factor 2 family protein [Lentilactobacillus sp. Marseille-Q4993]|uniref:nuclear transport factor 2 family protein n=1 Tax=Lentilactobacillus sp. Marseille-Q4993 TaxID=3039492 RepID=UPI0024BC29C5|nr:nuclear transport factor 2 family protein [Lentilactobacillus sp. Marseille-Q4993]
MGNYEQIVKLMIDADSAATDRNVDRYLELFTDDATIYGEVGHSDDSENLRAFINATWQNEPKGTVHICANPLVDEISGDEATARSVLVLINRHSNSFQVFQVSHKLIKGGERWQFTSREIM